MPEIRTAVLRRDAERLALAGRDIRAVGTGRREDRQRDRLDDRHEQGPGGMGELADPRHRLQEPEEIGVRGDHPGHGPVRIGEHRLQGGEVGGPGRVAVGHDRDLVELEPAPEVRPRAWPGSGDGRPRLTSTRSRRVARQVMSAASAVAAAPS